MEVRVYRGYRLESSSVGTDIMTWDRDQRCWVYLEQKIPLDKAEKIIDRWLDAK